jgi:16S rRNA (uracil1498-N3)-methyltransferase
MTRRRWIADEVTGNRAFLIGEHAHHLTRVLRARIGQEFDVSAQGVVRRARISAISNDRVEFELGNEIPAGTTLRLTLALAIFKFDRMEWAIEKCTELGATCIIPLIAHRTDTHLAAAAPKRRERWQRIVREASEQSRRVAIPEISSPLAVKDVAALPGQTRILLAESEPQFRLKDALHNPSEPGDIILAIGPEGGWTKEEEKLFQYTGWIPASLGSTVLRAETAAIAATAIVVSELQ